MNEIHMTESEVPTICENEPDFITNIEAIEDIEENIRDPTAPVSTSDSTDNTGGITIST